MRVKRTAVTDQPYINCNVVCGLDLHEEVHVFKFWSILCKNQFNESAKQCIKLKNRR